MQSNSPDQSSAGFTLLELLAVIGVVSVLLGVGLGYLGKTDPMMVANSILAGERRAAQMTRLRVKGHEDVRSRKASFAVAPAAAALGRVLLQHPRLHVDRPAWTNNLPELLKTAK